MRRWCARLSYYAVDAAVGCVVFTGAGGAFCAGGDVQVQAGVAADGTEETPEQRTDQLRASMEGRDCSRIPKPTIAMLNGVAAGAGFRWRGLRSADRRPQRADDDGVRQGWAVGRLRRHMVSAATGWHGQARELYFCPMCLMRRGSSIGPGQPRGGRRGAGGGDDGTGGEAGERSGVAYRYIKRTLNVRVFGSLAARQRGFRHAAMPG